MISGFMNLVKVKNAEFRCVIWCFIKQIMNIDLVILVIFITLVECG
jgi:hypothetical protein